MRRDTVDIEEAIQGLEDQLSTLRLLLVSETMMLAVVVLVWLSDL